MKAKVGIAIAAVVVIGVAGTVLALRFMKRDVVPVTYSDIQEHFKYGSIGTEKRLGIPAPLFDALPVMFADLLPQDRPGTGWEKLGFIYEPGHQRPVGTTLRELPVPMVGLNCGSCHTGTLRDAPGGERKMLLGSSANLFDITAYFTFLLDVADPDNPKSRDRFTPEKLLEGIKQQDPDFGFLNSLLYRYVVLPQVIKQLRDDVKNNAWLKSRPAAGPGRVDTFNPYKVYHHFDMTNDHSVGTSDYPIIYNQQQREGMQLHWDGNNDKVDERNISAAIGAGAEPDTLDFPQMLRVRDWILTLQPPAFPADKIDRVKADRGKLVFAKSCGECHAFGGAKVGKVTPLAEIGTDPGRLESFTAELAAAQNTLGKGYPWQLSHFRKTDGYANAPLDGVWLGSPYLHNGSVPTLHALLWPEERPAVFYRAYDVYDYKNVGYVSSGPDAEKLGWKYDTSLPGNHNTGHLYGKDLPPADKDDLIEYMKTL